MIRILLKNSHYFAISLLFLLETAQVDGQVPDWFVLNDCGYLVNVRGADADANGNLYVSGEYHGEMMFKSANDTGKNYHDYISENLQQPFLAKYDSTGELIFISNLVNRSGNSIYAVTVKTLSAGEVAWVIRADGQYSITGTDGKEHLLRVRSQSVLIIFSSDGELLSQTPLPLDYCRDVLEIPGNRLLLFGMGQRERINEVYVLDKSTGKTERILADFKNVRQVSFYDEHLWLLSIEQQVSRTAPNTATIKLSSVNTTDFTHRPTTCFIKQQAGFISAGADLVKTGDRLMVVLRASINPGTDLTLDSQQFHADSAQMTFFAFDIEGTLRSTLSMDTRVNGYYNTSVAGSADGGYFILTPARDYVKISGEDIIPVMEHPQFTDELVLIRLNKNFSFEWLLPGGGTASNYHESEIVPFSQGAYVVSDLLDYGSLWGTYRELNWRSGFYVGKVNTK